MRNGFFRNYLLPNGLAKLVDASVLAAIKAKEVADEAAARKLVDEATALATALTTISKFTVRMKTGEAEGRERRIFGAVLPEMVVDAIAQQTSVKLDKAMLTMPEEIKTTGSYPVTVRLHPQVNAAITLLVAKL